MNSWLLQSALWFSIAGTAMTGGVFFAFSTFVMTALGNLPPAHGLAAMQSINRSVPGSLFLAVFLATTAAALVVALVALAQRGPGAMPALAAAGLFVAGSFAVTAAVNVPLNDSMAALDPAHADSAQLWTSYLRDWTRWNHVRTVASLLAMAGFVWALRSLAPTGARL